MAKSPVLAVFHGDGIGPEVVEHGLDILSIARRENPNAPQIVTHEQPYDANYWASRAHITDGTSNNESEHLKGSINLRCYGEKNETQSSREASAI